ncbi:MAG: GNAT family N-acetyltransferase [Ascidiaceihabitans sp.]|uniref:GNAT family N-acetyltransferase n=1 Tax=Ascidiaceihabitans sp. TaxID=1872644 RepID=UPI00329A6706
MILRIRSAHLPEDAAALATLAWAYRDLLIGRTGHVPDMVERYYSKTSYAALIADLPRIHARPFGDILVADLDGDVVGCAMYYPHPSGPCEVKRIYVSDAARGLGAGGQLLQAAMRAAKTDGHTRMVLDTVHTLTEAIALYEKNGFQPCDPFYDPDPAFANTLRFFDHAL